jgi:hypothetical protein
MSFAVPIDRERITRFCKKWRVKELALFGSVTRPDFRAESDVDILVELQPNHGLSLYDWVDMIEELEGMFGRRVDLVARGGLKNPLRKKRIEESAEVVYAA